MFIKENYYGTYRDPFAVQEHPGRRHRDHRLRLGKEHPRLKNIGFIALSDGGCFKTLQVVLEAGKLANYDEVIHTGLYSSLRIKGKLVLTPQAKQPFELNAESVEILGDCPADEYPLQKKEDEHGVSAHHAHPAPPATNTFNAAFRVRSVAASPPPQLSRKKRAFFPPPPPAAPPPRPEGAAGRFRAPTPRLCKLSPTQSEVGVLEKKTFN